MIIDAHCHLVPNQPGLKYALEAMSDSGVDATIMVPGGMIAPLGMADYLRGREPLLTSVPNNDFVLNAMHTYVGRIFGFFHVDPSYHDEADFDEARQTGFCGFKLSPLVNRVSFNSPDVATLCSYAQAQRMPLYTHVVANGDASLDALEPLIVAYPKLPFILGHMGFASTDASAIRLAQRLENLFLETSVGSCAAIKAAVDRLGPSRVIFGSEGPVHHPAVELRKLEILRLQDSDYELICSKNIINIANLSQHLKEHAR